VPAARVETIIKRCNDYYETLTKPDRTAQTTQTDEKLRPIFTIPYMTYFLPDETVPSISYPRSNTRQAGFDTVVSPKPLAQKRTRDMTRKNIA
jgi:hypothetical protein